MVAQGHVHGIERGSSAPRRVATVLRQLAAASEPLDVRAPARQLAGEASRHSVVQALDEHGYCILLGFLSAGKLAAMRVDMQAALERTPMGRNKFEGGNTRRVYAIFAKTREFDDIVTHPVLLGVVEDVLGTPHFNLSSPVGIQIWPGERAQLLHRDDGKYPIPRPHQEVVINMMFALDDFTELNGSTLLSPGSHLATTNGWVGDEDGENCDLVREATARARKGQFAVLKGKGSAPDQPPVTATSQRLQAERQQHSVGPNIIQAMMPAGSVMLYRGSLLHGGGANSTAAPRLGVIIEFCAGWLRPQENHVLAVPRSTVRKLPSKLQELLGYNVVPPFVGYVDGRHPRKSLELESD